MFATVTPCIIRNQFQFEWLISSLQRSIQLVFIKSLCTYISICGKSLYSAKKVFFIFNVKFSIYRQKNIFNLDFIRQVYSFHAICQRSIRDGELIAYFFYFWITLVQYRFHWQYKFYLVTRLPFTINHSKYSSIDRHIYTIYLKSCSYSPCRNTQFQ